MTVAVPGSRGCTCKAGAGCSHTAAQGSGLSPARKTLTQSRPRPPLVMGPHCQRATGLGCDMLVPGQISRSISCNLAQITEKKWKLLQGGVVRARRTEDSQPGTHIACPGHLLQLPSERGILWGLL